MFGAGEQVRTVDIFLGKEVLYQLSYTRIKIYYTCYLLRVNLACNYFGLPAQTRTGIYSLGENRSIR